MNNELRDGRKQHLVVSAKKAFAADGYYSTSISQIVQEAGIARSTFYQYFDNKLHIFQSILDAFLQDLSDCIRPVALGPGALPTPEVQIHDNLVRVLELVMVERELSKILLDHSTSLDRSVEDRMTDFYGQVAAMIRRSSGLRHSPGAGAVMQHLPHGLRHHRSGEGGGIPVDLFSGSLNPPASVEGLVKELMEFGMGGILAVPRDSLSQRYSAMA